MRAYQLKRLVNGVYKNVSIPFQSFDEAKQLLVKLATTPSELDEFTIEEVEVNTSEVYRHGNTVFIDNFVRGVFYNDHPEYI